jgi:hypothetical protein
MIVAYKVILQNQTSPAELTAVLKEMQSYKGFWSDATTKYITGLSLRGAEILSKVNAYSVENSPRKLSEITVTVRANNAQSCLLGMVTIMHNEASPAKKCLSVCPLITPIKSNTCRSKCSPTLAST